MKKTSIRFLRNIIALSILTIVVVLCTTTSQAVYINQGYKKGVAVTGNANAMFSSNLLEQLPINNIADSANYKTADTIIKEESSDNASFSFDIYNYAPNMPNRINPNDIKYNLTVTRIGTNSDISKYSVVYDSNNYNFTDDRCTVTNAFLARNEINSNQFTIIFPQKDIADGVRFAIKAEPLGDSTNAVDNKGLAIVVTPIAIDSTNVTANIWSGHWVEQQAALSNTELKPSDCSAFNYEISGSGNGTITLTWPEALEIDKLFIEKNSVTVTNNSATINVDADKKALYIIRFYRTGNTFDSSYSEESFKEWPSIEVFKAN